MKILSIVGTRPNFMKIAPIIHELSQHSKIEHFLVHTGQHYDQMMSDNFFNELQIPKPDVHLQIGSDTHAKQVAKIMIAFEDICDQLMPDAIIVVGDVNSTMACSLVAAKKNITIFHVEAGIRSFDRTMPEEINRLVTDAITNFFLPPSQDAVENLLNEGHHPNQIHLVGNVMIDTLLNNQPKIQASSILEKFELEKNNYAVLTLHRPSNVDDPTILNTLIDAIEYAQNKIKIVYPIHPRTSKMLEKFNLTSRLESFENLLIIPSLGYFDFGKLISNSKFVLTDSGGIQEETTVYKIPCITLRENTERPITITEGTNELAGTNYEKIIHFIDLILNGKWKSGKTPKYWDGQASKRIVSFIKQSIHS